MFFCSLCCTVVLNWVIWFQDMDLIEVLWKQDVDLGFSLDMPGGKSVKQSDALEVKSVSAGPATSVTLPDDDIEKLKTLEALNNDALKVAPLSYACIKHYINRWFAMISDRRFIWCRRFMGWPIIWHRHRNRLVFAIFVVTRCSLV